MDAEIKQKWVAALRSGEYAQASGALMEDAGCSMQSFPEGTDSDDFDKCYCSLGVLLVVMGCPRIGGFLVPEEEEQAGINHDALGTLITMNDARGDRQYNFPQIADYIEQNL